MNTTDHTKLSELSKRLDQSWQHHQHALEGLEQIRLHMEASELELEAAQTLSVQAVAGTGK